MTPKNILILMSDEQRWDTLGYTGNDAASTPTLDALAACGTSFEQAATANPLCCPARTSLWTSRYPHEHHVVGNWRTLRPELRDGGAAADFAQQGYHTIYTGKWHVPGTTPARLGFQDTSAIPAVLEGRDRGRYIEAYRDYLSERGYALVPGHIENLTHRELADIGRPGKPYYATSEIALEDQLESWQTRQLLEALDRRPADKPFFAVCSYSAPHFPMVVPEPFDHLIPPEAVTLPDNFLTGLDGKPNEVTRSYYYRMTEGIDEHEWRQLIAHYWGFCSLLDEQVRRTLAYLDAHGLRDNTLLVYLSDHGDMMGSHGLNQKGYPLHYEEALRVPLLIVDPDQPRPVIQQQLVSLIDVVPTLAEMVGVQLAYSGSGRSFASLIGKPSDTPFRDALIAESFQVDGEENGEGSYVNPLVDYDRMSMNASVRTATAKYIFRTLDHDEYYDLSDDPGENVNRIDDPAYAGAVEALRQRLLDEIGHLPRFGDLLRERIGATTG